MKDEYALLRTGQNWPKKCHFRPPTGGMCLYSSSAMNKASENAKVSILSGYLNKNFFANFQNTVKTGQSAGKRQKCVYIVCEHCHRILKVSILIVGREYGTVYACKDILNKTARFD